MPDLHTLVFPACGIVALLGGLTVFCIGVGRGLDDGGPEAGTACSVRVARSGSARLTGAEPQPFQRVRREHSPVAARRSTLRIGRPPPDATPTTEAPSLARDSADADAAGWVPIRG